MHIKSAGFRRVRAGLITLLTRVALSAALAQSPADSWKPDMILPAPDYPFTFVAYCDIRFTDRLDTQHSNAPMRRAEVARIAQEKPPFVIISGDLVFVGANAQDWKVYDGETESLRQAGIEVLPALGNHDVSGDEAQALKNYFQRFPKLEGRRWYSVRAANLMMFMLDSTSDDAAGSPQIQWLERGFAALPKDVDFVPVALHHPPMTRSLDMTPGGGHSPRPQEKQLASLLEKHQQGMRARILLVAGHVHNYERYEHGGVTYIVSRGGGATPYMIKRADNDFYREPGAAYHICNLTVDHRELRFQMLKLTMEKMQPEWTERDSFVLQAASPPSASVP